MAGLLVLALGSGAVAQSSSPEATPLYAPEDLAFVLPRHVAALSLDVETLEPDEVLETYGFDWLQDLLVPHGKDPTDLHMATAFSNTEDLDRPWLFLSAMRVEGVDGVSLVQPVAERARLDPFFERVFREDPVDPPYGMTLARQDIGGRNVMVVTRDDDDGWFLMYPKGEVLFTAVSVPWDNPTVTIEDVLAELP